jgi:glycosyltransferase involved in cell wall biosynthesis
MESSNGTLLSICVCSFSKRREMCNNLCNIIMSQIHNVNKKYGFEVATLYTHLNDTMSIGAKRHGLVQSSNDKFIVFIDDDDMISDDYVELIIDAIIENPNSDCIGMKGIITFDGGNEKKWEISKEFGKWFEANNVYYRTPNHISPIRTSIAKSVGFPDIRDGEDYQYSMGVLPLLQNEVKIDKEIYHYQYITNK